MKSLNQLSSIVAAFIKSFWTAGDASICNDRPTIISICSNGFSQLLRELYQSCTTFAAFLISILPKSLGKIFLDARLTLSLKLAISPAMIWLDSIHLWSTPSNVLIPIIPPDPFCSMLIICSMTWSGGNLLKLPLDLLTEKGPFMNSR